MATWILLKRLPAKNCVLDKVKMDVVGLMTLGVVGGLVAQKYPERVMGFLAGLVMALQLNVLVQVRSLKYLGNKMIYSTRHCYLNNILVYKYLIFSLISNYAIQTGTYKIEQYQPSL